MSARRPRPLASADRPTPRPTPLEATAQRRRPGWTAPTRRRFLGLLMAAGAGAVATQVPRTELPPRSTWHGKTRWIGHC